VRAAAPEKALMEYTYEQIAGMIDHSLLNPTWRRAT
jgi:hypothetical protein